MRPIDGPGDVSLSAVGVASMSFPRYTPGAVEQPTL